MTLINDTNIISLILAWTIVRQKSSDDILNGINKLEGLLIVSVFQMIKERQASQIDTNESSCTEFDENMENICDFLFDENC